MGWLIVCIDIGIGEGVKWVWDIVESGLVVRVCVIDKIGIWVGIFIREEKELKIL